MSKIVEEKGYHQRRQRCGISSLRSSGVPILQQEVSFQLVKGEGIPLPTEDMPVTDRAFNCVLQVASSPVLKNRARDESTPRRVSHTASAHDPDVWQAPPVANKSTRPSNDGGGSTFAGEECFHLWSEC